MFMVHRITALAIIPDLTDGFGSNTVCPSYRGLPMAGTKRIHHMTVLALLGLAIVVLALAWNSPVQYRCYMPTLDSAKEQAKDAESKDGCHTIGFFVSRLVVEEWDVAAHNHGFEALIAAFTLLLAGFTATLWWTTRGLLKHAPKIERAYISGGGVASEITSKFQFHLNNHGKTPGRLIYIEFGFCDASEPLPVRPLYTGRLDFFDWIGPGTQSRPITSAPIPEGMLRPAIYGRLHYKDIFGAMHSSGFILESTRRGTTPLIAPPEYTESD